jgi:hypothetical protein
MRHLAMSIDLTAVTNREPFLVAYTSTVASFIQNTLFSKSATIFKDISENRFRPIGNITDQKRLKIDKFPENTQSHSLDRIRSTLLSGMTELAVNLA